MRKKKIFKNIFIPIDINFKEAKRKAFCLYLSIAKGKEVNASTAIIKASIIMQSLNSSYFKAEDMGFINNNTKIKNIVEVVNNDINPVENTRLGLSNFLSFAKRKNPVSKP